MADTYDRDIDNTILNEEDILDRLREHGLRITSQRKLIVDIIVNEQYSCCKEVYLIAHKRDNSIGIATVYRMINTLEEIGAISRGSLQKTDCNGRCCDMKKGCTVVTQESKQIILSEKDIEEALKYIIEKNGYADVESIKAVLINEQG